MNLTYLYECSVHGEITLEHRITEDRKNQYCPRLVRSRFAKPPKKHLPCGAKLKPLIALGSHNRDQPAVFHGYDWPRHAMDQYRVERCNEKNEHGEPVRSFDPVAVR